MSAYKTRGGSRWAPCLLASVAASLLMTATLTAQEGPSDEESEEPPTDPLPQEEGEPEEGEPEEPPTDPLPEENPGEETSEPSEQRTQGGAAAEYLDLCSDTKPALYKGDCQTLQATVDTNGNASKFAKPYQPRFQLWADGETKDRFIHMEGNIIAKDANNWEFPVGTILYKTFSRAGQRVETRIIKKVGDSGNWTFATWGWKSDGTAESVTTLSENWQSTGHNIPSIRNCNECHRAAKAAPLDPILGFTAIQLNLKNGQVMTDAGEFESADSASLQTLSDLGVNGLVATIPGEEDAEKALGYMYANCSHCHGGSNPAGDGLDLSIPVGLTSVGDTPAWKTAVCEDLHLFAPPPEQSTMTKRIDLEAIESSAVLWRMQQRTARFAMPRLATKDVHTKGVDLVRKWITSNKSCDPKLAH